MSTPRTPRVKGFTLIELMIVVAIVATLVAMLIPAVSKSRETARKVLCSSKMRQTMLLVHTYQVDFGVILPAQYYTNTNIHGQHIHATGLDVLYRYYSEINEKVLSLYTQPDMERQRSRSLVACPSSKVFYPVAANNPADWRIQSGLFRADPTGAWRGFAFDYGISIFNTTRYEGAPGFRYYPVKRLKRADSESLYMIEVSHLPTTSWSDFRQQGINMKAGTWWRGKIPHAGTLNYAAYDGHVSSFQESDYLNASLLGFTQPAGFLPVRFDD